MTQNFPPSSWSEMSAWMEPIFGEAFNHSPTMHHLCRKAGYPLESIEGLAHELAEAEKKFRKEIKGYLTQICTKGTLDLKGCSPGAAALVNTRIREVQSWVWSIECGGNSPVPFPNIPFTKFAKWLFNDWWEDQGRESAAQRIIAEAVDRDYNVRILVEAGWVLPKKE